MFGRRKKDEIDAADVDAAVVTDNAESDDESPRPDHGPFDIADVEERLNAVLDQRLDLGSVVLPLPPEAQLQVEIGPDGSAQGVHLVTEWGRITVAAYAAPRSPGQWREVTSDLAESLRGDNAEVSVENGPWGREVVAVTEGADLRFVGVDGPRWMVRLVAAGPPGSTAADAPLVRAARAVLADTVVRRGSEPQPARAPLPVILPAGLAQQLAAAHQQQLAQIEAERAAAAEAEANAPKPPRRAVDGSAMQQLGQ